MLIVTKALGVLLLPPGILLLLAVLGLFLQYRWRYFGLALVWVSVLTLLILSLPLTGYALMDTLEDSAPPLTAANNATLRERAQAIVILGGGRDRDAPEYGGDTVSEMTLARLRYGARLHRASGLPVLVSGGSVFGEPVAEGDLMQQVLTGDFQMRAAWVEARSHTTYENAVYSRAILEAANIRRVVLVTHAWHMPRAMWAFTQAGMEVIPAPMSYTGGATSHTVFNLLPSGGGLFLSTIALHEWLGILWYKLAYGTAATSAGSARPPAVSSPPST